MEFRKTSFFAATLMGAAVGCTSQHTDKQDQTPPNIIFIMSDDHAEQAISCYGGDINSTPNIDRLATEGVRFTNACVTNSICAPSRAVILTGKHSHMNGLMNNRHTFDSSQVTFPKLLQKAGYETAVIGKWHLKSPPSGFDYWKVLPGQGHYYNPDFIEMGEKKREQGYVTDLITEYSLDWLKEQAASGQPFCLLMQHKAPHRNWMPALKNVNKFDSVSFPVPETFFDDYETRGAAAREQTMEIATVMYPGYDLKLSDKEGSDNFSEDGMDHCYRRMDSSQRTTWNKGYRAKNDAFHRADLEGEELALWKFQRYMQDYLGTVESVDESVGKILEFLDSAGLAENTIVVYTSDQGFYLGEHGWFDKRFMYEESLSTPLLIRYPEKVNAGETRGELVQNLDFAETFLDYAGVDIPDDMQGRSLRPLMDDEETPWRDALYYHYYEYPAEHGVKRHYGIRTDQYKLIHFYFDVDEWELYDTDRDPQELNNLYGKPGYDSITEVLKNRLQELKREYKVPDFREELSQRSDTIKHLGVGATSELLTKPAKKYYPGPNTLTDGLVYEDSPFWTSGYAYFLGYRGDDMILNLDLGAEQEISSLAGRFLHRPSAWIYEPSSITLAYSTDGINYTEIPGEVLSKEGSISLMGKENLDITARYLKVIAKNYGNIPKGNPGEGSPSWLFCDEVVVR